MSAIKTKIHRAITTGAAPQELLRLQSQLNAELRILNGYRLALYRAITQGLPYKIGDTVNAYGGGLLSTEEYLIGTFTIHDMRVTDQGQIICTFMQDGEEVEVHPAYFEKV